MGRIFFSGPLVVCRFVYFYFLLVATSFSIFLLVFFFSTSSLSLTSYLCPTQTVFMSRDTQKGLPNSTRLSFGAALESPGIIIWRSLLYLLLHLPLQLLLYVLLHHCCISCYIYCYICCIYCYIIAVSTAVSTLYTASKPCLRNGMLYYIYFLFPKYILYSLIFAYETKLMDHITTRVDYGVRMSQVEKL